MIKIPAFSSVYGKIEVLLMAATEENVDHFARIIALRKSMPSAKLIVWCTLEEIAQQLQSAFKMAGLNAVISAILKPVPDEDNVLLYEHASNYNAWIRDAFMFGLKRSGVIPMLNTVDQERSDEGWGELIDRLNFINGLDVNIEQSQDLRMKELDIAGGNVLIGDDDVLMGKEAPLFEKCLRAFIPNAQMIYCGAGDNNDLYHLDIFLTLTGFVEEEQKVILLAECISSDADNFERVKRNNGFLKTLKERLEHEHKYKVKRMPLILTKKGVHSYNNVLVSVTEAEKNVWIPRYSFENKEPIFSMQETYIETLWNNLEFKTNWIDAPFNDLLQSRAGLHCITNEFKT